MPSNHSARTVARIATVLIAIAMASAALVLATPSAKAWADGDVTITSYLGIDPETYQEFLQEHSQDDTYLDTTYPPELESYRDGARNTFDGWNDEAGTNRMNCEGFIDNVFKNCGALVPCAVGAGGEGWTAIIDNRDTEHYDFESKEEMLLSGELEYGDIIWMYDGDDAWSSSDLHHVGIFIGQTSSEDKIWHSISSVNNVYGSTFSGNQISQIIPQSDDCRLWRIVKVDHPDTPIAAAASADTPQPTEEDDNQAAEGSTSEDDQQEPDDSQNTEEDEQSGNALPIIVLVVALIGAGVGVYLYSQHKLDREFTIRRSDR